MQHGWRNSVRYEWKRQLFFTQAWSKVSIMLYLHPHFTAFCALFILVFSLLIVIWITDRHLENLNGTQEVLVICFRVQSSPIQTRDQFFLLLQTSFVEAKNSPWLLLPQVPPLKLEAQLHVWLMRQLMALDCKYCQFLNAVAKRI